MRTLKELGGDGTPPYRPFLEDRGGPYGRAGFRPRLTGVMKKYVCNECGYIYDPAEGDPDAGIEPGTAFEDLPRNWVCPVCGAPKNKFTVEE